MTDDLARPPRFPYVAALLCAACLGAAAWTWVRYSYVWEVTPDSFWVRSVRRPDGDDSPTEVDPSFIGRYVRIRGELTAAVVTAPDDKKEYALSGSYWFVHVRVPSTWEIGERAYTEATFTGRACASRPGWGVEPANSREWASVVSPFVDTTASRLHGASIAGLVVGAMGVFVFTVALRHWLGERRKSYEAAEEA